MLVAGGSTDVTTYFAMRKTSDGKAATGLTPADFDMQYVRSGVAPVAKVDATALVATDSTHADNKIIEIDATDAPGLYRVDWPDAAFAADVREVILSVKVATAFTEHLRVEIDGEVTAEALGTQAKADVNAEADTALTDYNGPTSAELVSEIDSVQTDIAALNDLSAAQVNAEADTALADYDAPTRTEATSDKDEIITDLDDIKGTGFVKDTHSLIDIETFVDLIDDGTSGLAKIASDAAATLVDTAVIGALGAGLTDLGGMSTGMKGEVNAEADTALTDSGIEADLDNATDGLGALKTLIDALNDITAASVMTTQMTESYAADGVAPTPAQILHLILAVLTEFAISGTTLTAKKLDGIATAATFTLDDATNPTSLTRAT